MIYEKRFTLDRFVRPSDLQKNQVFKGLPEREIASLLPLFELVQLKTNAVLAESGSFIKYCYFPINAVVTLVSTLEDGRTVEVGLIGHEGMVGVRVLLGCDTGAYMAVVQIAGSCLRIPSSQLKSEFKRGGVLQDKLLQYIRYMLAQVSQTAACNRVHLLEQRLSRWLLSLRDRVDSEELNVTHELISQMLGGPRSDVSRAASRLKDLGLISIGRGKITVLDRNGLTELACECYQVVKNDYVYTVKDRSKTSPAIGSPALAFPKRSARHSSIA